MARKTKSSLQTAGSTKNCSKCKQTRPGLCKDCLRDEKRTRYQPRREAKSAAVTKIRAILR